VVQIHRHLRFVLEHLAELRRLGERGVDLLDHEDLREALCELLAREVHLGHTP
jgi:hypothetical protein